MQTEQINLIVVIPGIEVHSKTDDINIKISSAYANK